VKSALWLDLTHETDDLGVLFRSINLEFDQLTLLRLGNLKYRDLTLFIDLTVYNSVIDLPEVTGRVLTPTSPRRLNQLYNYRVLDMFEKDRFKYSRTSLQKTFSVHIWDWMMDIPRDLLTVYINENDFLLRAAKMPLTVVKTVMGKKADFKMFAETPTDLQMFLALVDRVILASNVLSLLRVCYPRMADVYMESLAVMFKKIISFSTKDIELTYFYWLVQIMESILIEDDPKVSWFANELIRKLWNMELTQLIKEVKDSLFNLQCSRYYKCKRLFRILQFSTWKLRDADSFVAHDFADLWSNCGGLLEPKLFIDFLQRTPLIRKEMPITTKLIKNSIMAENCYASDIKRYLQTPFHPRDATKKVYVFDIMENLAIISKSSTKPGSLQRNSEMDFSFWKDCKKFRKSIERSSGDTLSAWRSWVIWNMEMFLETCFKVEGYTSDGVPVLRMRTTSHPNLMGFITRLIIKSHHLRLRMPFLFDENSLQKMDDKASGSTVQNMIAKSKEDLMFSSKSRGLSAGFQIMYSLPQIPSLDTYLELVTAARRCTPVELISGFKLLISYGRLCRNGSVEAMSHAISKEYSLPANVDPAIFLNFLTGQ
jgi:hypothetical protein